MKHHLRSAELVTEGDLSDLRFRSPRLLLPPALVVTGNVEWAMKNVPNCIIGGSDESDGTRVDFTDDPRVARKLMDRQQHSPILIDLQLDRDPGVAMDLIRREMRKHPHRQDVLLWVPPGFDPTDIVLEARTLGVALYEKVATGRQARGPLHKVIRVEDLVADKTAITSGTGAKQNSSSGGNGRELLALTSLQERVRLSKCRIDAIVQVCGEGRGTQAALNDIRCFERLITAFREPFRSRLINCVEEIANPTPVILERNGRLCRKLAFASEESPIIKRVKELLEERYWISDGLEGWMDPFDSETQHMRRHPALAKSFFLQTEGLADRYESMIKLAAQLDPDVMALIDQLPLPEDSKDPEVKPARQQIRNKLEAANIYSFGADSVSHRNGLGFIGRTLYTQECLDDLGFSGKLGFEFGNEGKFTGVLQEGADWGSVPELNGVLRRDDAPAKRVRWALELARNNDGLHVFSQPFNGTLRHLYRLDNVICWGLDSISDDSYGKHAVTIPVSSLVDPIVCLADDVMMGRPEKPSNIASYARSRISLHQFQELIIDLASKGELELQSPSPDFKGFAIWDARVEIQTQGCFRF